MAVENLVPINEHKIQHIFTLTCHLGPMIAIWALTHGFYSQGLMFPNCESQDFLDIFNPHYLLQDNLILIKSVCCLDLYFLCVLLRVLHISQIQELSSTGCKLT